MSLPVLEGVARVTGAVGSAHGAIDLDRISIASPCTADWNAMRGDDRVRFCEQCGKHVYDLSSMTRADAQALVAGREGKMCARFWKRRDGTLLTADCPVGLARVRRRIAIAAASIIAIVLATVASAFGARRTRQCATEGTHPLARWVHTALGAPTPVAPMGLVAMPVATPTAPPAAKVSHRNHP